MALPMYVCRRILHGPSAQRRVLPVYFGASNCFSSILFITPSRPHASCYHSRLRINSPILGISQSSGRDICNEEQRLPLNGFFILFLTCSKKLELVELASTPSTSDLLAHAANAPLHAIPQGSLLHIDPAEKGTVVPCRPLTALRGFEKVVPWSEMARRAGLCGRSHGEKVM